MTPSPGVEVVAWLTKTMAVVAVLGSIAGAWVAHARHWWVTVAIVVGGILIACILAAIGYVLDLLQSIEFNTRDHVAEPLS